MSLIGIGEDNRTRTLATPGAGLSLADLTIAVSSAEHGRIHMPLLKQVDIARCMCFHMLSGQQLIDRS